MATKKFSALSTGTTANAADKIPIERAGANLYITPLMVKMYIGSYFVARYTNSASMLVASGADAIINFNTPRFDPGATVTTGGAWHFTTPVTGWYDVRVCGAYALSNSAVWVAAEGCSIDLYINGSYVESIAYAESDGTASTSHNLFLVGSRAMSLTAADTVKLHFNNFSADDRYLASDAAIEIYRVA